MDALKLAFDTVIVGALALPWVAMGIYLFLGSRDGQIVRLWLLIKENQAHFPPAVAAVLLFATAYSLGAAVSRVSGDFFNDHMWSFMPTEDNIRRLPIVISTISWRAKLG